MCTIGVRKKEVVKKSFSRNDGPFLSGLDRALSSFYVERQPYYSGTFATKKWLPAQYGWFSRGRSHIDIPPSYNILCVCVCGCVRVREWMWIDQRLSIFQRFDLGWQRKWRVWQQRPDWFTLPGMRAVLQYQFLVTKMKWWSSKNDVVMLLHPCSTFLHFSFRLSSLLLCI